MFLDRRLRSKGLTCLHYYTISVPKPGIWKDERTASASASYRDQLLSNVDNDRHGATEEEAKDSASPSQVVGEAEKLLPLPAPSVEELEVLIKRLLLVEAQLKEVNAAIESLLTDEDRGRVHPCHRV